MKAAPPSDRRSVVAEHKHDTTLFVLAFSAPCTEWQEEAQRRIGAPRTAGVGQSYGRRSRAITPAHLNEVPRPESWVLGVLICPGDDLRPFVSWARRLPARSLQRIRFFAAPSTDPDPILRPWSEALSPLTELLRPATPIQFTGLLLRHLNDWIYNDHAPNPSPGTPPA